MIHLFVFAEGLDAGSQNDKVPSVGDCHSCAVDAFVSHPCGFQLIGVQIGDKFFCPALHMTDVQLFGELDRKLKWFSGRPCVKSVQADFLIL